MRSSRSRRSERPAASRRALKLGAALLVTGLLLASPSLLVPGVALVAMPLVVLAWARLSVLGARVGREPAPARVLEGEPFDLVVSVRSGWLPPMLAKLRDPTGEGAEHIVHARPRHRFVIRRETAIRRRGRHLLAAPALLFADPFGFVSREVRGEGRRDAILVLPRIEEIRRPGGAAGSTAGILRSGLGEHSHGGMHDAPADPELDGLRPHRPGSPASRIYWPALARGDELLERRLEPAGGSGPLVALDASGNPRAEDLDRAVRAAASICRHLSRRGGCELLLPASGRRWAIDHSTGAWEEAHAALALVELGHGAPAIGELAPEATLIWVGASATVRPPRAARGYLVVPEALPGRSVEFTVAGCRGHSLQRSGRRAVGVAA